MPTGPKPSRSLMARHGPSHIRYVSTMTELDLLVKALAADLGDPSNWGAPVEFRDSLALCALNSAYSLQRKSVVVARLLARYRALRPSADTDSGLDLIQAMDDAGGPETFARDVLNNNSPLPGTRRLRTVGIYEALTRLAAPDVAVATAAQLRDAAEDPAAKKAWQSVSGLGPMSWSYLLMNAGVENEIKPDVMVQRYLTRVLGEDDKISAGRARRLLVDAAGTLGVKPRALDRAVWLHESPSTN